MARSDRLFELIQLLRRASRPITAQSLAQRLEVAVRTVYRDIAVLQSMRVPIDGEVGIGYIMRPGFDLPPLMFTATEAQALVAAIRLAQPRLDAALAASAETALSKILAVLPAATRAAAERLAVYAPPVGTGLGPDAATRARLATLRLATDAHQKLQLHYRDLKDIDSQRTVRPLGCFFWGQVWTLAAWCEGREDFRSFRVDRISTLVVLDARFRDEPGRSLADLFRRYAVEPP